MFIGGQYARMTDKKDLICGVNFIGIMHKTSFQGGSISPEWGVSLLVLRHIWGRLPMLRQYHFPAQ